MLNSYITHHKVIPHRTLHHSHKHTGFAWNLDHAVMENKACRLPQLKAEAARLIDRKFPMGMAIIMGEISPPLCEEIRNAVIRLGRFVSWASVPPMLVVIFQKDLMQDLMPIWRLILKKTAGVHVGVAISTLLDSSDALLIAARMALLRAISNHKEIVALNENESIDAVVRFHIAQRMKDDLEAGGRNFSAHFQPQVNIDTGKPIGAEALARWHLNNALFPPGNFIPIAEESGLITTLGDFMLKETACTIRRLRETDIDIPRMAVNVSPGQLHSGDFLDKAIAILKDEGLHPSDIELEITETLSGNENFLDWSKEMQTAGFCIAIDDFGCGNSTLTRVRDLPVQTIKLDKGLMDPVPHNSSGSEVFRTALNLVHNLGKVSLAEGVETAAQVKFLSNHRCTLGQGFFWSRALPESSFASWWRNHQLSLTPLPIAS